VIVFSWVNDLFEKISSSLSKWELTGRLVDLLQKMIGQNGGLVVMFAGVLVAFLSLVGLITILKKRKFLLFLFILIVLVVVGFGLLWYFGGRPQILEIGVGYIS
jgi:hypothetical protein